MSRSGTIPCLLPHPTRRFISFSAWTGLHRLDFACISITSQEFSFEDSAWDRLAFQLCGFRQLLLHQPLCQQHYIRRVNAEEDVQDLCLLLPSLDPSQGVMLLLRSERSLHRRGANSSKFLSHKVLFPFLLPLTSRGRLRLSEGPVPSGFQCIRYREKLLY